MERIRKSARGRVAALALAIMLVAGLMAAWTPAQAHAGELQAADQMLSPQSFTTVTSPAAPKIKVRMAAGSGKIAVYASKVSYAQGYEFQVARNSSFTKGVKKKKVKAYGATFSGLAKGKKYYVRARAYQTSTNLCTQWSGKKTAKSGIAYAKSKLVGKWKLVSTNSSSLNSQLASLSVLYPGKSVTYTLNKKGKAKLTFPDGTKKSSANWVATARNKGYEYGNYQKGGTLSLSGGKLTYKSSSFKMVFTRA